MLFDEAVAVDVPAAVPVAAIIDAPTAVAVEIPLAEPIPNGVNATAVDVPAAVPTLPVDGAVKGTGDRR